MAKKYPDPIKRKDSGKYFFWFTESDGSRRKVSTGCGKGQKEAARQFIRNYIDKKAGGIVKTFREYSEPFFIWESCPRVNRLLEENKNIGEMHVKKSRSWLENYVYTDTIFPDIPINEIKRGDILDLRQRVKRVSPGENTTNKVIVTVKTILSEAAYRQDITVNPGSAVGNIKYEQKQRAKLELSEVHDLLSYTANPIGWDVLRIQNEVMYSRQKKGFDYKKAFQNRIKAELKISIPESDLMLKNVLADLMIATFICTGIRAGELRGLVWSAVDMETGRVRIDRAFKSEKVIALPKWNKTREIALPKLLLTKLEKWKHESPYTKPDNYVFSTADGNAVGQSWIRKNVKRVLNTIDKDEDYDFKIDGDWITPHAFRHTLNTHLLAAGVPPLLVQSYLGWSSEEEKILTRVQKSYTELRLFNLEDVSKKIDEIYTPDDKATGNKLSIAHEATL